MTENRSIKTVSGTASTSKPRPNTYLLNGECQLRRCGPCWWETGLSETQPPLQPPSSLFKMLLEWKLRADTTLPQIVTSAYSVHVGILRCVGNVVTSRKGPQHPCYLLVFPTNLFQWYDWFSFNVDLDLKSESQMCQRVEPQANIWCQHCFQVLFIPFLFRQNSLLLQCNTPVVTSESAVITNLNYSTFYLIVMSYFCVGTIWFMVSSCVEALRGSLISGPMLDWAGE